ncbi:MAG TPA: substrate-binding domain-containing protein, partial [Roseiarcus sp.]
MVQLPGAAAPEGGLSTLEGRASSSSSGSTKSKAKKIIREETVRSFIKSSYLALAAVAGALAAAGHVNAEDKTYVVGVSNTLIGNGWREEMVCSIKAEALASGKVSKVILANRNGGPSEQIADIRNLISAGANIIIVNPSDRKALDPVIKQATDRGIVVVAV